MNHAEQARALERAAAPVLAGVDDDARRGPPWLRPLFAAIRELLFVPDLDLDQLLEAAGLADPEAWSALREEVGQPAWSYLRDARLETAAYLLLETDLPIAQIGYLVGYNSPPSFRRLLRSFLGQPPSEYRSRAERRLAAAGAPPRGTESPTYWRQLLAGELSTGQARELDAYLERLAPASAPPAGEAEARRQEVAAGYGDFATPLLEEGETAPDIDFQLELMKRSLTRGRERLQELDAPLVAQSHEEAKIRGEIETRMEAVEAKLRRLRHVCRGIFGDDGVQRIGLVQEPSRAASRLYQQGMTVKLSLEKPDLGLESLLVIDTGDGVASPTAQLAAQLEPELSELGELVSERYDEYRKASEKRLERRQAIQEFDRVARAIVRMSQGLFRLVGRDDLANRFRPILQRVVRSKAEAEEVEAEESAAEPAETSVGSEPTSASAAGTPAA